MSNPNSANQRWSRWIFLVYEGGKHPTKAAVELNAALWARKGFGSAGSIKVTRKIFGWRIDLLIEGPPAHDPGFVQSVRKEFQERFVAQGFGLLASSKVIARVVAGSLGNGKPSAQLIELPSIPLDIVSASKR